MARRRPIAAAALLSLAAAGPSAAPVGNRAPLAPTPLVPLPLGAVRPAGWLLTELRLQRDGLTGHAEEVIPNLGPGSGWLGGTAKGAESWEKGPYYVKGLVALAYTLDDAGLKRKAQKWVDWSIQSQRPDGSFGPAANDDWWPRMVMTYALRDYAEATGDPRVVPMLSRYLKYVAATLPERPLAEWGKARAGDLIDTAFWVYNRTGDEAMLRAADLLHGQAYDWTDIFTRNRFLDFGRDFQPKHAVNVTQALKMPPVWYQRSHEPADRDAFAAGMGHLLGGTTLPLDVPTGTEFLSGRSAIQGVETCTVVEQMLSDETAVAVLDDPAIADDLERTAYNALPGAMTKDLKLYQYYTPTNVVVATRGGQGFNQDYADGLMPGPVSGFPCCCYNLHMGWPMFVQHAWMATADGGLAAVVYGPTAAHATLPAGDVTVTEATNYPFDGDVHLTVAVPRPAPFPLTLHVPAWAAAATIAVNGKPEPRPTPGTFATVRRTWADGDRVDLTFPMPLATIPGVNGSVSLARGPLVFSLKMAQHTTVAKPGPDGFQQLEFTSPDPWNVALNVDPADPAATVHVHAQPMPATGSPFDPAASPVSLEVPARRVPSWNLTWTGRSAEDPPLSPVRSDEPEQAVTLVPFGAQTLRVTAFPRLGTAGPLAADFACDFTDTDAPGWVAYGGGWFVKGGQLHAAPDAGGGSFGTAGVKSVATATDFADLTYAADVTPGPVGDAGLIFRVAHPAIGPNAFDGYYAGISSRDGRVMVGKCSAANEWTRLAEAEAAIPAGRPTRLRVVAVGPSIKVYVGDGAVAKLTVTDDTYARGAVGVRQYTVDAADVKAAFGRVSVTRP